MISRSFLVLFSATIAVSAAPGSVDFSRDIRPILNTNCISCHGGVKKSSGVSFLFREEALEKGKSGAPTIVIGDPDQSEMYKRIISNDPKLVMPQPDHGPPLKQEEIDLIRQWIEQGAKWGDHWSFELPKRTKAPDIKNKDQVKSKIDSFIVSRLATDGLTPAEPAPAAELLRRLNFDIVGLPPSLAELDAFEKAYAENQDAAVEAVVDRLLASPNYGERWATPWLDLARYADSEGLGVDRERFMYPYRDWVIRALNQDMPFDTFTTKQMAGDLLPDANLEDYIATAFHRLTQSNEEGGTDDEEFRVGAVMDRISTTWQAWQGLTFNCVQCHSHPYEPIRHNEYYTFMAFFNDSRDLDLDNHHPRLKIPYTYSNYSRAQQSYKIRRELMESLVSETAKLRETTKWTELKQMTVRTNRGKVRAEEHDGHTELRTVGTVPQGMVWDTKITLPEGLTTMTALKLDVLPLDLQKAIHTPEWGAVLSYIRLRVRKPGDDKHHEIKLIDILGDDPFPPYRPKDSLIEKKKEGWGPYSKIYKPRHVVIIPESPVDLPPGSDVDLRLRFNKFLLAAFPIVPKRARLAISDDPTWTTWYESDSAVQSRAAIEKVEADISKIKGLRLPIMDELAGGLKRSTRHFDRGNWLEKVGPDLKPNVPASLNKLKPANPKNPTRLDLAKWITSPENPLTSRVAVNRVWEQLFGWGIVETLEDFGSSGRLPTYPELLDDLAVRYREDMKWSTKTLIKELVMSSTYRQSQKITEEKLKADPRNQLLTRGPRTRLSAEMMRDQSLKVSGLINRKLYGYHSYPPIPSGGYTAASNRQDWRTNKVGDAKRYRRSIYTYIKRSSPYPTFAAFDVPTREVCSTRRITSNTPIAALTTLNDPAFFEACRAFAKKVKGAEGDVGSQLKQAYRMATSRKVSDKRLAKLQELYDDTLKTYQAEPQEAEKLKADPELAALITVCSVLFNLDETLTK